MKKLILLFLLSSNCFADQILVSAVGHDIDSHHYFYSYILCANKQGTRTDCNIAKNQITVLQHSTWNNHFDSFSQPRFSLPTGYSYTVTTNVSGYAKSQIENKYSVKVNN